MARRFFFRKLCLIGLLLLFGGLGPGSLAADDLSAAAKARQLQRLQQGMAAQEALATEARRREQRLQAELAELERQVTEQSQNLQELGRQISDRQQRISSQQDELALIEEERLRAADHLSKRLVAAYRLGTTGLLNILFTAHSLPELLDFQENIERMIEYDRLALAQYRNRVAELEESGQKLLREEAMLQSAVAALRQQEEELARAVARHATLLRQAQNEKLLYQQAQREIAAAAARIESTLAEPDPPR